VVFTAERVEYIEHIKTEESIANDWQIPSSVLQRKCAAKVVRL